MVVLGYAANAHMMMCEDGNKKHMENSNNIVISGINHGSNTAVLYRLLRNSISCGEEK
jgi:hypothetical protein